MWFFFCIIGAAHSQWVQSGSIPPGAIALSPDGSTIIGGGLAQKDSGIYTLTNNIWTLTQPLVLGKTIFLSYDGSMFASSSLYTSIDIFKSTSPGTWKILSTIYASTLGLNQSAGLAPAAVTSDGNTLVITSTTLQPGGCNPCFTDIFILTSSDNTNFVLKQQMSGLPSPTSFVYSGMSLSSDGTILATLWTNGTDGKTPIPSQTTPVIIFKKGSDGLYTVNQQNDYSNWNQLALSPDGQIMIGASFNAIYDDINGYYQVTTQAQYFSRVNELYQLMSVANISSFNDARSKNLPFSYSKVSMSLDAAIVFFSSNSPQARLFILKRFNQTSWLEVEDVSGGQYLSNIYCSSNGSTFVIASGPSQVYTGPGGADSIYSNY
jgi:hypothetical protein